MQGIQKAQSPEPGMIQSASIDMTKMIAENIFRDLRSYGLDDKDIVAVSSELINHLTSDIRTRHSHPQNGK